MTNARTVFLQDPAREQMLQAQQALRQQIEQQIREAQHQAQQAAQQAQAAAQDAQRAAKAQGADAARQAEEAARAAADAVRAAQEANEHLLRTTTIGTEMPMPPMPPDFAFPQGMIPPEAVTISIAFFISMAVMVVGWPLARAFGRRVERRAGPADADLAGRLERIENAVETIAIEVERVSEGQRFTNNIMSELRALPQANPLDAKAVDDLQRAAARQRVR